MYYAYGNRLDDLATRLGRDLGQAGDANPLIPHTIVIPHPGMGRWLRQHLAKQWGIAAGLDLVLPGEFVWRLARALGVTAADDSAFDAASLRWRLLAWLPTFLREGQQYQAPRLDSDDPRAMYELATRLASAYDRYLVFRPDWIAAWERGEAAGPARAAAGWQAALWRRVRAAVDEPHRAAAMTSVLTRLQDGAAANLPARVNVFGIASLPPLYLRVLLALAARTELAWYHPNPCGQWWGDIRAGRERAARVPRNNGDDEDYLIDEGHALLASWGRLGREFVDTLYSHLPERTEEHDLGGAPGAHNLLSWIKHGVYTLNAPPPPPPVLPEVRPSVRVHTCPTRWREVEILHDALLGLFARDATLTPRDVVVMSPDIGAYADLLRAAFDEAPEAQRLPHSIADRVARVHAPLNEALRRLIDLPLSRLTASDVLDWLTTPAVARARGLDAQDLAWIRVWIDELRIRWGADGASRATQGTAAFDEYAWRPALTRALLSYAAGEHDPDAQTPVYANIEGDGARVAGALLAFIDDLDAWRTRLQRTQPAPSWQAELLALLEAFVEVDPRVAHEGPVLAELTRALAEWVAEVQRAGQADLPIAPDIVRAELAQRWLGAAPQGGYLGAGITVCAMVPMRNVPFRVVCLLGLNDGEFPRGSAEPGLDLMHGARRVGDRSPADDDRFLMLEAMMAAGAHWHLSYVCADPRDGSERPPSVLVTELVQFILAAQPEPARDAARQSLVLHHAAVPHDRCVFAPDAALPTYSITAARAANAARTPAPRPFAMSAEALRDALPQGEVILQDVMRLLTRPSRSFLRGLDVYVAEHAAAEDDDPVALDELQRWQLRTRLFEAARSGEAVGTQAHFQRLRAQNLLPPGVGAMPTYDEAAGIAVRMAQAWRERIGAAPARTFDIQYSFTGGTLRGRLHDSLPSLLSTVHIGKLRGTDVLTLALRATALRVSGIEPIPAISLNWNKDQNEVDIASWDFAALPDAWLTVALAAYAAGQHAPLPLYPKASWAYACAYADEKKRDEALRLALRAFVGNDHQRGDLDDADIALVTRDLAQPLDHAFQLWAERLLVPLVRVQVRV